jgi:two-component system, LuxR family, sensor kinase FixL
MVAHVRIQTRGIRSVVFDPWVVALLISYLVVFALLDWIRFVEPFAPLGIRPWDPTVGLGFALVLHFGYRMAPLLFIGPLLGELVDRQTTLPWLITILCPILIGGIYLVTLSILRWPRVRFDPALSSLRDLILLMIAVGVGTAVVAANYVLMLTAAGLLSTKELSLAALHYWIGQVIGILGLAPLVLFALTRRRLLTLTIETGVQCAAILAALWLVFGSAEERQFQLFYVLFLPVVWLAVRAGTEGVSVGIVLIQLGVILGAQLYAEEPRELIAFQSVLLVLTVTGLVAGELVTERRRAEARLRLHQESLERLARLGSIGELAAAVAHEVNQPLTAAGTYTRLLVEEVKSGDVTLVSETAKKAVAQIDRAAEVIRRLRALVRLDRSDRVSCALSSIVRQALTLSQPQLDRANVKARVKISASLPPVLVDRLQIEQVLLNLVRNSVEAIAEVASRGSILIEGAPGDGSLVQVRVTDSGPGFSHESAERAFLPLSSNKSAGLGIGLPLCRSIIEAHGGRLLMRVSSEGGAIEFTLPVANEHD